MIVQRLIVRYQVGKLQEAIDLLKKVREETEFPHAIRLYVPRFGEGDRTVGEFEFESIDQMEKFWTKWEELPAAQAFHEKYSQVIERGMVEEIFELL